MTTPTVFRLGLSWAVDWHADPSKPRISEMPDKETAQRCAASGAMLHRLKVLEGELQAWECCDTSRRPKWATARLKTVRAAIAAAEGPQS